MDESRETYWARRLRPIRPGAEPVEAQLARRYYGMVVISVLTALIGLMILAIFAGFGRADIGFRFVDLVFLPAIAWFWVDYGILRLRTSAYLAELGGPKNDDAPPD